MGMAAGCPAAACSGCWPRSGCAAAPPRRPPRRHGVGHAARSSPVPCRLARPARTTSPASTRRCSPVRAERTRSTPRRRAWPRAWWCSTRAARPATTGRYACRTRTCTRCRTRSARRPSRTARRGSRPRARTWCWSSARPTSDRSPAARMGPRGRAWSSRSRATCRRSTSGAASTLSRSTRPHWPPAPGSRRTTRAAPGRTSTSARAPARRRPRSRPTTGPREDVYAVAVGNGQAVVLPEIYATKGGNARAWGRMVAWSRIAHPEQPIRIIGALTEAGACAGPPKRSCPGIDLAPAAGLGSAHRGARPHRRRRAGPALPHRHQLSAGAGPQAPHHVRRPADHRLARARRCRLVDRRSGLPTPR